MPQGDAFPFVSTQYSTLTWTGRLSLQQAKETGPGCSSSGEKSHLFYRKGPWERGVVIFQVPALALVILLHGMQSYTPGTRVEHPGSHEPEVMCFIPESGFLLHHFGEEWKLLLSPV